MSHRIQRINALIKQQLAELLLKEVDFPKNILVTVAKVETSTNLSQSKVYISTMPESQTKKILQILKEQVYSLQQKLNQRLKMRAVPKIIFLEEKETSKAGRIEQILAKLKMEK